MDTELVVERSSTRVDSMSSGDSVVSQGGPSDGDSGAVADEADAGGPGVGSARGGLGRGSAPESTGTMSAGQGSLAEGGASGEQDADSGGTAGEGSGGLVQAELDELGDPDRLRSAVEAVLLVVDSPTSAQMLAQVLGRSVPEVEGALHSLRDDYDVGGRGFDLREVADGWRLYSRDEFAAYVERFVLDGQRARLTQAALETLAVIAYRQPVTRSRISGIRGVSVDAVMRTLLTRGLVEECGADPETGGGLYRTTSLFLEKMGLRSLDELPSLAPLLPDTSQLDDVELST
jgi:segregation and condensation protein B